MSQVELRELSRDEDTEFGLGPSNTWRTTLTLRAEPPYPARVLLVLRATDTKDPDDQGATYLTSLDAGTGKLELHKYTPDRIAPAPEYRLEVVGWVEMRGGRVAQSPK